MYFARLTTCENRKNVIVSNSDKEDNASNASSNELTLLYGQKWKSLWFSAGPSYIEAKHVAGLFSNDTFSFSTVGLAYSILRENSPRWLLFFWNDVEISEIINPESNYFYMADRFSF